MNLLIITTFIWAFSFSLIGVYLSGQVEPYLIALIRFILAFLVFLPFFRWKNIPLRFLLSWLAMGGVQIGMMSLFYYASFLYLTVPEILLFTILTPFYIQIMGDISTKKKVNKWSLLTVMLAIAGAAIIRYTEIEPNFWFGFLLVQGANLCFAIGQVWYKAMANKHEYSQRIAFSWFYLGAMLVSLLAYFIFGGQSVFSIDAKQWGVLLWLGIVASGLGYFMWNIGAVEVETGVLAIMNNAIIPLGIIVNLFWGIGEIDLLRFGLGTFVILLSLFWQTSLKGH